VLDRGLDPALSALAGTSAIPVTLTVTAAARAAPQSRSSGIPGGAAGVPRPAAAP